MEIRIKLLPENALTCAVSSLHCDAIVAIMGKPLCLICADQIIGNGALNRLIETPRPAIKVLAMNIREEDRELIRLRLDSLITSSPSFEKKPVPIEVSLQSLKCPACHGPGHDRQVGEECPPRQGFDF